MKIKLEFETRWEIPGENVFRYKQVKYVVSSALELYDRLMKLQRLAGLYTIRAIPMDNWPTILVLKVYERMPSSATHVMIRREHVTNPEKLDETAGAVWEFIESFESKHRFDRTGNQQPAQLRKKGT